MRSANVRKREIGWPTCTPSAPASTARFGRSFAKRSVTEARQSGTSARSSSSVSRAPSAFARSWSRPDAQRAPERRNRGRSIRAPRGRQHRRSDTGLVCASPVSTFQRGPCYGRPPMRRKSAPPDVGSGRRARSALRRQAEAHRRIDPACFRRRAGSRSRRGDGRGGSGRRGRAAASRSAIVKKVARSHRKERAGRGETLGLRFEVAEMGPNAPWGMAVMNRGTEPVEVVFNPRLLVLEVEPPPDPRPRNGRRSRRHASAGSRTNFDRRARTRVSPCGSSRATGWSRLSIRASIVCRKRAFAARYGREGAASLRLGAENQDGLEERASGGGAFAANGSVRCKVAPPLEQDARCEAPARDAATRCRCG